MHNIAWGIWFNHSQKHLECIITLIFLYIAFSQIAFFEYGGEDFSITITPIDMKLSGNTNYI